MYKLNKKYSYLFLTILLSLFGIAAIIYAVTTIGNNIFVGGNLEVSGNATTTGNHVISGNLNVSGNSTLATTTISNLTVSGNATTTGNHVISGNLNVSGNSTLATTTIGGGTAIVKHLSATTSIDVPSVGTSSCVLATTSITGVNVGDTIIGTPQPTTGGIETLSLSWNVYVDSNDTVALRVCNVSTANTADPANQTWRFDVWKH